MSVCEGRAEIFKERLTDVLKTRPPRATFSATEPLENVQSHARDSSRKNKTLVPATFPVPSPPPSRPPHWLLSNQFSIFFQTFRGPVREPTSPKLIKRLCPEPPVLTHRRSWSGQDVALSVWTQYRRRGRGVRRSLRHIAHIWYSISLRGEQLGFLRRDASERNMLFHYLTGGRGT